MEKFIETMKLFLNEIEKLFRYLIPGFMFLLLFKYSGLAEENKIIINFTDNKILFILVISLILGMLIYSITRVLLYLLIDTLFYRNDFHKVIMVMYNINDDFNKHFYHRLALVYSSLMFSIELLVFSILSKSNSIIFNNKLSLIIIATSILIISLLEKIKMNYVAKEVFKNLKK